MAGVSSIGGRGQKCVKVERGMKTEYRLQSSEYGGVKKTVQRCKSDFGRCEGGKVKSEDRGRKGSSAKVLIGAELRCKGERGRRPREDRVQSTDYGTRAGPARGS